MNDQKTIIIKTSMFDDEGLDKSHASLIVLKGAEIHPLGAGFLS